MHYFELLRPTPNEWAAACDDVACPAACVIKCRQFACDILDPIWTITAWPSTVLCYGHRMLSKETASRFDDRFAPYGSRAYSQPATGPVYTYETESWLIDGIAAGSAAASWKRCF